MNVSSGTGLPGFSRTISTDRKTVVLCVCVCGVTPDIHVLDGVYVPQVEGVNFGVFCPHWPNGFNGMLIVCGAI